MLETGDTCQLKGEKGKYYTVVSQLFDDSGSLTGYRMTRNSTGCSHWIREHKVKPTRKKKGRTKATQASWKGRTKATQVS